ncbi:MAG: DnaA ATPase domain-containing protein, partial [Armatimonadota bacterium]
MAESRDNAQTIWDEALAVLSAEVGPATFETVFRPMRPLGVEDGHLLLTVNNQFAKDWIEDRHIGLIARALHGVAGRALVPEIVVAERGEAAGIAHVVTPEGPPLPDEIEEEELFPPTPLHAKYTFENFVEGNSNRFAYALALNVARAGADGIAANPLFIWGGVGVGQTHLMQAIGHHVMVNDPGRRVVYVSAETFVNHVVMAIRDSKTAQFRARYRNVDLWLVDDVQFIASKDGTRSEEEFFHTFNTLYQTDKQIVMSSDQPPRGLRILDERLRSRFEAGAIVDIKRPDVVERIAILQKKASITDVEIPLEVF